jgi:hypothetical protein
MRRILLILVVAGSLTAIAGGVPPPHPGQIQTDNPPAVVSTANADTPPEQPLPVQPPTQTQAKDDSRLKRFGMLLATFTVMAAIAARRSRPQRP